MPDTPEIAKGHEDGCFPSAHLFMLWKSKCISVVWICLRSFSFFTAWLVLLWIKFPVALRLPCCWVVWRPTLALWSSCLSDTIDDSHRRTWCENEAYSFCLPFTHTSKDYKCNAISVFFLNFHTTINHQQDSGQYVMSNTLAQNK